MVKGMNAAVAFASHCDFAYFPTKIPFFSMKLGEYMLTASFTTAQAFFSS
jgi:hypothetical protein